MRANCIGWNSWIPCSGSRRLLMHPYGKALDRWKLRFRKLQANKWLPCESSLSRVAWFTVRNQNVNSPSIGGDWHCDIQWMKKVPNTIISKIIPMRRPRDIRAIRGGPLLVRGVFSIKHSADSPSEPALGKGHDMSAIWVLHKPINWKKSVPYNPHLHDV